MDKESQIKAELREIIDQIGHFPTSKELTKLKKSGLHKRIYEHSNVRYFQQQLGFKSITTWTEESVIKELENIVAALGTFPTTSYLMKTNYALRGAIGKFGGFKHFADLLGLKQTTKPHGYWQDIDNVKREINSKFEHLTNLGKFPTSGMIAISCGSSILTAINRFGGIKVIAKEMGCKTQSLYVTSDGHFVNSSYEYIVDEFLWSRGIEHETNGKLPNSKFMYDFKVADRYIEIWGYEQRAKGISVDYAEKRKRKELFYKENNLNLISLESAFFFKRQLKEIESDLEEMFTSFGYDISLKEKKYNITNVVNHCFYWNSDKVIEELKVVISKIGHFPSHQELMSMERGDLRDALGRHGGVNVFREKLDYPVAVTIRTDEEIIARLKNILHEHGEIPCKLPGNLHKAIYRNGGKTKFRLLLGLSEKKKPVHKWSMKLIFQELEKVVNEIGKFPSKRYLHENNRKPLSCAIKRNGGFLKIRKLFEDRLLLQRDPQID